MFCDCHLCSNKNYVQTKHKLINQYLNCPNFMTRLKKYDEKLYNKIIHSTNDELMGEGVLDTLKSLVFGRHDYPPAERKLIQKYGNSKIVGIEIYREPLAKTTKLLVNILSLGQIEKSKKKYAYDELFHLYMIVYLSYNNTIVPILLEKNEVIKFIEYPKINTKAEKITLKLTSGFNYTFKQFLSNAEKLMGNKYWFYNPFTNNCQIYVLSLVAANPPLLADNPKATDFIYQDVTGITSAVNPISKNIMQFATTVANRLNVLLKGNGI